MNGLYDERLFDDPCDRALGEALCKAAAIDVTLLEPQKLSNSQSRCAKALEF
jgi:hypothetical protein